MAINKIGNKEILKKFFGDKEIIKEVINGNTIYEKITSNPIYGVSGLYDSSPSLTRTDDALNMSVVVNSSTGLVSSDFDNVFPWNEAVVETISGNKFLHLPDMWFRIGKDSGNHITDVAVSKVQDETGDWYKVDNFYYGCYGGSLDSNDKLASVSGVSRLASKTRAEFRGYASANGLGYSQLDLYHRTVMMFLWLIEFANKDSKNVMTGSHSRVNTGGTDSLSTPSGYNKSTYQMRWHYIEDFIGNIMEFIDGYVGDGVNGGTMYVNANPNYFGDTPSDLQNNYLNYNAPLSSLGQCLKAIGWDSNNPFLVMPIEVLQNTQYNTWLCGQANGTNAISLATGSANNSYNDAGYGLTRYFKYAMTVANDYVSGRLIYNPAYTS